MNKTNQVFKTLQNEKARKIITLLGFKQALLFNDLLRELNMTRKQSGSLSHTLMLLKSVKLISHDKRMYYLSRAGIESIKIIRHFENKYRELSISECNEDGRVEKYCIVIRERKIS